MTNADSYFKFIDDFTANWQHLLDALKNAGVEASVWQSGGMCMLITWALDPENGAYACLSTQDGPLPFTREEALHHWESNGRRGSTSADWALGIYMDEDDTGEETFLHISGHANDPEQDDHIAALAVPLAKAMYEAEREFQNRTDRKEIS